MPEYGQGDIMYLYYSQFNKERKQGAGLKSHVPVPTLGFDQSKLCYVSFISSLFDKAIAKICIQFQPSFYFLFSI